MVLAARAPCQPNEQTVFFLVAVSFQESSDGIKKRTGCLEGLIHDVAPNAFRSIDQLRRLLKVSF